MFFESKRPKRIENLSPEEEKRIILAAKLGDVEAANTLFNCFKAFCYHIARKVGIADPAEYHADMLEAIHDSIRKFDTNKENRFSTFFVYDLKAKLAMARRRDMSMIHLPTSSRGSKVRLEPLKKIFGEEEVDHIDDPGSLKLLESLFDNADGRRYLNQALTTLTPQERQVLEGRFLGDEEKTLRDIAGDMEVTHQRVFQIQASALNKLKEWFKENKLSKSDFLD